MDDEPDDDGRRRLVGGRGRGGGRLLYPPRDKAARQLWDELNKFKKLNGRWTTELRLPPSSGYLRVCAHDFAERLGLLHTSTGEGSGRTVVVQGGAAPPRPPWKKRKAPDGAAAAAGGAAAEGGGASAKAGRKAYMQKLNEGSVGGERREGRLGVLGSDADGASREDCLGAHVANPFRRNTSRRPPRQ